MHYDLVCTKCGTRYAQDSPSCRCGRCRSVLEVEYDYKSISLDKGFRKGRISHSKYAPLLPVHGRMISLGEGGCELRHMDGLDGIAGNTTRLHLKVETQNPTKTFKDRGTSVEISKAVELGFDSICCASTGNMGLSLATYSESVGLGCTVFLSKDANREKIGKIKEHNARIKLVDGGFNKAMALSESFARKNGAFMCGDYHYRKEGQKTVAFEIIEQLGYKVPDYIFVQVGNATLLAAVHKALIEFRKLGFIKTLPKLVAVQAKECNPLVRAYTSRKEIRYVEPHTAADAIAVGYPTFGFQAIAALKGTRGTAISVGDAEIERYGECLERLTGITAELGGATGFAGFADMCKQNPRTFTGKDVVVIVTGNNES